MIKAHTDKYCMGFFLLLGMRVGTRFGADCWKKRLPGKRDYLEKETTWKKRLLGF
jgi:hypothetical protein